MFSEKGTSIRAALFYNYASYHKALIPIAEDLKTWNIDVTWYSSEYIDLQNIEFLEDMYAKYDAIFLGVGGIPLLKILEFYKVHNRSSKRPILLTLFPGIRNPHDRLGYLIRALSDIILLGSVPDLEEYNAMSFLPKKIAHPLLIGFPQLTLKPQWHYSPHSKNIIFYYQSIIFNLEEIKILAHSILDAADKDCFEKIYIVRKNIKSDAHVKIDRDNIFFGYLKHHQKIDIRFSDEGLTLQRCFSISSTKSLETIKYGCPTFYPDDFGFSDRKGNLYYQESGLTAPLTEILNLNKPLQRSCSDWEEKCLIDYSHHKEHILNILKNIESFKKITPTYVYFVLKAQIYFIKKITKIKNKFLGGT